MVSNQFMDQEMLLSIVIPVYNEVNTLAEILRLVREEKHRKEIIIVDDYSTDGTREILGKIKEPDVKIILLPANRGKGAAVREGFRHVTGDLVIIQDADLEYYPDEYEKLLKPILDGKADVVYGSRFLGAHRAFMFWHYLGNKLINVISNIVLNTFLTDMMTCYKAFRTPVIRSLTLECDNFGIEPEITAEVFKRGYKVYEVPISFNGRDYEEGKKVTWKDFFRCIYWLVKANFRNHDVGKDTLLKMQVMKNNNSWVYEKLRSHLGKNILELGSGIGTFSSRLSAEGKNLTVSDIDPGHLQLLRERFIGNESVKVVEADAFKVDRCVENDHYDTVVSLNMMEHVEDDVSAFAGIHKVLRENGELLLLVPAHKWLYGSLDREISHFRRYSRKELTEKLRNAGFQIKKMEYMNFFSVFGWYLNFILLKRKTMPLTTIRIADKIIPAIAWIESKIRFNFGLSLFCVAVKKRKTTAS